MTDASITADRVRELCPPCPDASRYAAALEAARAGGGLITPRRVAHFMAQVCTETAGLHRLVENLNYTHPAVLASTFHHEILGADDAAALIARGQPAIANRVYAGRFGNGDEASGDGWKYRGRGGLQLTFRNNYSAVGRAIGMDLEGHPELLEQPEGAFLAAAKYWAWRGINTPADADDVVGVTRLINPALAGLDDRKANLQRAKVIWS